MKFAIGLLVVSVCISAQAQRGTAPKASVEQYASHADLNGVQVGAVLLSKSEVRKNLGIDLDRFLVVEIAVYPEKDGRVNVLRGDFALRVQGEDEAIGPATAEALSARLENDRPGPEPGSEKEPGTGVGVTHTSGVGYRRTRSSDGTPESKNDGVYISTGTDVSVGAGTPPSGPEARRRERQRIEADLRQMAIPEGTAGAPVAGYVYFLLPKKKMNKKAKLQIEYAPGRNSVVLPLN